MSTPVVDPLRALWVAVGSPTPNVAWQDAPARCARCGHATGRCVRVADVVSDKFTGWDDYANGDRDPRWCPACAWGHTESALRQRPWVISDGYTGQAGPSHLLALLSAPFAAGTAVIVPLGRKKHLLPAARWGVLTTDDVTLSWGPAEADRIAVVACLRGFGYSETALAEPAPRFEHLRTQPAAEQVETMRLWPLLDPWRAYPPLLAVALRATRKDKS